MDFSDNAERALEQAVELAADSGRSVACVHAYEDPPGTAALRDDPAPGLESQLADAVQRSRANERGVHVQLIVRRGPPWDKLLNVAADLGSELIVVGASGQRGPFHNFFLGSVASRLAATSTRSVLVVPNCLETAAPRPRARLGRSES
jgi:nucleotide-binding universal stress UspA family protein